MSCDSCRADLGPSAKFCAECGVRVRTDKGNSVSTGGGDIHGGVYQAGGDIFLNPAAPEPPSATYEAVPVWRSPLTLALLSWVGLVLGLIGVVPLWQVVKPVVEFFVARGPIVQPGSNQFIWLYVFLAVAVLLVGVLALRRTAKTETRWPFLFGLAINGEGRRITFEKIRADRCPRCGGKLKYYSKPTRWINHIEPSGRRWREVTERVPALECKRNSKHWVEVDPAEGPAL